MEKQIVETKPVSRPIAQQLREAQQLLQASYYQSAKKRFVQLQAHMDCAKQIAICDFNIALETGDEYFINRQYEKALEQYALASEANVDSELVTERTAVCQFTLQYQKAQQQIGTLEAKWQENDYAQTITQTINIVKSYEAALKVAESIVFKTADARMFVSKRLQKTKKQLHYFKKQLEDYQQYANRLFAKKQYKKAKKEYEELQAYVDCTEKITACRFHLLIEEADEHFINKAYPLALLQYQTTEKLGLESTLVKERLAICHFCIAANQSHETYQKIFDKETSDTNNEAASSIALNTLADLIQDYHKTIAQAQHIPFVNADAKIFVEKKLNKLHENLASLEEKLNSQKKQADALFEQKNYVGAKKLYEALQTTINCTTQIKACDFYILLEKANKLLKNQNYAQAIIELQAAKKLNINNISLDEQIALAEFYQLYTQADTHYFEGNKQWHLKNEAEALQDFKTALHVFEKARLKATDSFATLTLPTEITQKLDLLKEKTNGIKENLQTYVQQIQQLFEAKQYNKAKTQYQNLHPLIDCQQQINACDFYLLLQEAEAQLIEEQDFTQALTKLQEAKAYDLETQLVAQRIALAQFAQQSQQITEGVSLAKKLWIQKHYVMAVEQLKDWADKLTNLDKTCLDIVAKEEKYEYFAKTQVSKIDEATKQISTTLELYRQEADGLFAIKNYVKALAQYQALHQSTDCETKITACQFYLALEAPDNALYSKNFEQAIELYEKITSYGIEQDLLIERIALSRFILLTDQTEAKYEERAKQKQHVPVVSKIAKQNLIAEKQKKRKQQTNTWTNFWNGLFGKKTAKPITVTKIEQETTKEISQNIELPNTPKSDTLPELKGMLADWQEVKNTKPVLRFATDAMRELVAEKTGIIELREQAIQKKLNIHIEDANLLFSSNKFPEAKAAYEKIQPAVDCSTYIRACDFQMAIQQADKYLCKEELSEALNLYEAARKYADAQSDLLEGRLAAQRFFHLTEEAKQQYEVGQQKWAINNHADTISGLKELLAAWQTAKQAMPLIQFDQSAIQQLIGQKLEIINEGIDSLNQKLKQYEGDNRFQAATQLFESKEYLEAKRQFKDLHPVVDCSREIALCNFYLAIQRGDKFIRRDAYRDALVQYEGAVLHKINPDMVEERIALYHFCQDISEAENIYNLAQVKWQVNDFTAALSYFKRALQTFKVAKQNTPIIEYPENNMEAFVESKQEHINERIRTVEKQLAEYEVQHHSEVAKAFMREKSYLKARNEYELALQLRPNDANLIEKIKNINCLLVETASPLVNDADALFMEAVGYMDKKEIDLAQEKFEAAKVLYKKALSINPTEHARRGLRQCGRAIAKLTYKEQDTASTNAKKSFFRLDNLVIPVPKFDDKMVSSEEEIMLFLKDKLEDSKY